MPEAIQLSRGLNLARGFDSPAGRPDFDSHWLTITVAFHLAEDGREPPDRIREALNHTAQFMRRADEPLLWVYVQEISVGKQRHWHMALFVPKRHQAEFKQRFRRWVTAAATGPASKRAVYFKPAWRMLGWKQYLLKDGTDEVRASFDVPDTARYARTGGVVIGNRVGVSKQLLQAIKADDACQFTDSGTVLQFTQPTHRQAPQEHITAFAA